jgi:WD40 repeat protein
MPVGSDQRIILDWNKAMKLKLTALLFVFCLTIAVGIFSVKSTSPAKYKSFATNFPTTSNTSTMSYEGISILYDLSLAERVKAQTIPLYTDPSGFTYNDIPEHIRFDFLESYSNQEPFTNCPQYQMPWLSHQNLDNIDLIPQIFIFPTRGFAGISQLAAERIEAFKDLLRSDLLPSKGELPVLPLFNSAQDISTQRHILTFHGGRGVRFITRYTQGVIPVSNPTVFYTFQGLTDNGDYYVSAFFPIYVSSLPNRIEIEDWDAFNRQYPSYLEDTAESLQELESADFEPDLAKLDALIQSMTVLPTTLNASPTPAPFTSELPSISPYPEPTKHKNERSTATAQPLCYDTLFEPIAFLPDNKNLLGRTNTGILLLNLNTMEEESYIEVPDEVIEAAISNDGQVLALAFSNQNIQLSDSQRINTLEAHKNIITALKFSPTGDKLFSASHDNWVKIWDREGNLITSLLPGGLEVLGIGISPDGTKLATISFEGPMKLWDISKHQVIQEFESPYGAFDGADAGFSADGQIVARGIGGGPITLYKVSDGSQLWSGGVYALAFSPDGRFLAISDIDENGENIIVLSSQDGLQVYKTLRGHNSMILKLIFSLDGRILASMDDLELKVWRVENGQLLYSRRSTCP